MQRPILCLKELSLFQGLGEEEFNRICPGIINKEVAKGQALFRQGEFNTSVYLLKSGKVKLVQTTEDGRDKILSIVGPGEVLGEASLFQEQEALFSAVAIENVTFCGFNRGSLEIMIKNNPDFAVKIISHLAGKLNTVLQQVSESTGGSVKDKLLRLLIRLANEHGRATQNVTIIELNITQQEIGDMLGASRVKVSQVIQELKTCGIIGQYGKYYTIKTDFCVQNLKL